MEDICVNLDRLLKNPEEYLRPDSSRLQEAWMEQIRKLYNFTKQEEKRHQLPSPTAALPNLDHISNPELVWQLVQIQNQALLAAPDDVSSLDDVNLCLGVARLSSLAKLGKLAPEVSVHDEGIGASADEDVADDMEKKNDADLSRGSTDEDDDDDEEDDDEENEDDLFTKPQGLGDTGLNDNFDNDSEDEEDNFDQLIALEGQDSDDSEGDKKAKRSKTNDRQKQSSEPSQDNGGDSSASDDSGKGQRDRENRTRNSDRPQAFKKTNVDSQFFQLRESEWVADNDAIGENFQGGSDDDIDLMADMSDDSQGETAMYDTFFDALPEERKIGKKLLSGMLGAGGSDDNAVSDGGAEGEKKGGVEKHEQEEEKGRTPLLGAPKKESKSRFEVERERELAVMGQVEEDNIGQQPWYLRGEALNADRPEDSALQQRMEYDIAARPKPLLTEDTTSRVERLILGRVRAGAWDDVERKVKPALDPTEYKKKLLLDQDKSKKSLAQIYEEEYLKKQEEKKGGEEEEELPEHQDIRQRMDQLFTKLDALANFHYTPPMPTTDVKITSNLPAITLEEATPDTATSATLLAPQEIQEPVRGELVGATELTNTDRKRERRSKKARQRQQAHQQDRRLAEKLKRAGSMGKPGKLDKQATTRVIQKAVKAGHVKMLEGGQDKSVRSSQTFFKALQERTGKKDKSGEKKRTKDAQQRPSISKLLL